MKLYRIMEKEGYFSILYCGSLKSCSKNLDKYKQQHPNCYIEPVDNTLSQACDAQGWVPRQHFG